VIRPGGETGAAERPAAANVAPPPGHASAASTQEAAELLASVSVLDSRGPSEFALGHLAGAGRLTHDEFRTRRAELPPRTSAVLVVDDDPAEARRAATTLALLGYIDVRWLEAPLADLPGGHDSTAAPARLWRPSPFLERMLPSLPRGRALDLASGAGRDAVFLALNGWRSEAWDHDPEALERAIALAEGEGVPLATQVVELVEAELAEAPGRWDVIVVVRFLHRPLLPWIERALAPGGALVYETFRTGQERYGRPKNPRFLLEPGELRTAFPSLEAEHYEEVEPEGGPVLARLLARRKA